MAGSGPGRRWLGWGFTLSKKGDLELGSVVWFGTRDPSTGSGRTGRGAVVWNGAEVLWFVLLSVAHGVPSYEELAAILRLGNCLDTHRDNQKSSGADRYRVSQQAGMPAVGIGGRMPLQDRAKVGGGWWRVLALVEFDAWVRAR